MEKPILKNELEVKIEGVQKITDNMNEFKQYALDMKEFYSTLTFNDEQLKEAKTERASVNKIVKKVADYRKEIVNKFNEPLENFVNTAKEVEALLKDASNCIDVQVKKYEEEEKENKKAECENLFNEMIGDLSELVSFEKVFNNRWLNKTTKMSEVESDIKPIIEKINSGLNAIKELNSDFETELINTFLEDFDITRAIFKNTQLKEQKEKLSKAEDIKEEEKQEEIQEMYNARIVDVDGEKGIMKSYTLKITANYTKMKALKHFMDLNEIKYEKVA